MLWEISGKCLPQPSYFLGTMHLMCADDAYLSKCAMSVIGQVEQVFLETEIGGSDEGAFAPEFNMKDNKTLRDFLVPTDYELIKSFIMHHLPGLSFDEIEKQSPLMTASRLFELNLKCKNKKGLDYTVFEEASSKGKPIHGLETMRFQLDILNTISYDDQARELANNVKYIEKYQALMAELITAFRQQDIEYLHDLSKRQESGLANHLDILLYERNEKWVACFETEASKHSTLFAVGAAHLGGAKGVINLLRTLGYSLRPLPN